MCFDAQGFSTLRAATYQPSRPAGRRSAFSHHRKPATPYGRRPSFPHRRRPPFPQSVKRESRVPARGREQTFSDFPTRPAVATSPATPQPPHPPRHSHPIRHARSYPTRHAAVPTTRHARSLLSGRAHHSGDAALIATPAAAGVQSLWRASGRTRDCHPWRLDSGIQAGIAAKAAAPSAVAAGKTVLIRPPESASQ